MKLAPASLIVFCMAASAASPGASERPVLAGLEAIEGSCRPACGAGGVPGELRQAIDRLASGLRNSPEIRNGGVRAVAALNQLVFHDIGIRASHDLKNPANLLPSTVIERRQGYCVGIAAVYLLLAERLGIPVRAVATPSHLFLRYDDGVSRINIETFEQGASLPDEQYELEQRIPVSSLRRGVFLRNLTTGEFLAQVHNNLGVVYSERKDYAGAAREYEEAVLLDPRLPAAFYNYGNDLLLQDQYGRAARLFSRAIRLHPTDVWALNNRGLAYMRTGKGRKARRDLEEALRLDPMPVS